MKTYVCCAAFGFALLTGAPVANAQYLVTQPYGTYAVMPGGVLVGQPTMLVSTMAVQPTPVVQTVETVRTIRPAARTIVRHQIVAGNRARIVETSYSRPLYDYAGSAPTVLRASDYDYDAGYHPLYNSVATPVVQTVAAPTIATPVLATAVVATPVLAAPVIPAPAYRYDRWWNGYGYGYGYW
jgi:hypothetical protein